MATTLGVLAAAVQMLGFVRWPFLVPSLAAVYTDPAASQATREMISVVFLSFNQYAGVGIGEHLGYLFTAAWSLLVGLAMLDSALFPKWLGWVGILSGLAALESQAQTEQARTEQYLIREQGRLERELARLSTTQQNSIRDATARNLSTLMRSAWDMEYLAPQERALKIMELQIQAAQMALGQLPSIPAGAAGSGAGGITDFFNMKR